MKEPFSFPGYGDIKVICTEQRLIERERKHMQNQNEQEIQEQSLEATGLEATYGASEAGHAAISGELERVSATVEQGKRESELAERLAVVEHELAELKAAASTSIANPLRRTLPTSTSEMLAKHGIGDGPVDVRTLDAALAGLSLEQRIAVKTQLLRAGAIG